MPNLPLLLGHRGARASRSVPENTLASFDLALRHGCDGFEFDVRLAGTDRAIVCHDPKVGRITVSRATRRQLVHLPSLDDVLHRYAHRAFLNVELKVKGLETIVLDALREHQPERECVVSSFIPDVVMELKARSGIVPVGIICEKRSQLAHWNKLPVEYVMAHETLIDEELIAKKFKFRYVLIGQASYDTTKPGRDNTGHTFGDKLSDSERWAIIEYLKTL